MEAAPSVKPRRASPPIPPNYVSLRQLQELRLKEKEEQEKRQREEEEAVAAAAAAAKLEAARKAEMKAIAATVKTGKKVSAASSVASGWAKERRDGGQGHRWVAVAHQPAVLPRMREESVADKREGATGVGRGKKGPADSTAKASRGGGRPEGKAKGTGEEKDLSAVTRAQPRAAAAHESGKAAEASSHGCKPENRGEEKASGDESAEPGSIGGSGESAGASFRRHKNRKWKKGAGGRNAETNAGTAPAKTAGATPPQGVKTETPAKPKAPGVSRDSSDEKKADAATAPLTSAAAGSSGGELRTAEPEGLAEGSAVVVHVAAEQKPRVERRRTGPRPPGYGRNRTAEQHGRLWVPKAAAAGCAEL